MVSERSQADLEIIAWLNDTGLVRHVSAYSALPASGRNYVVRVRGVDASGASTTVVVKRPSESPWGSREEAALRVVTAEGVPGVVQLAAATDDPPMLALRDLGNGDSLADVLADRGSFCAADAESSIVEWAFALGSFHRRTAGLGPSFARRLQQTSPWSAADPHTMPDRVWGAWAAFDRRARAAGIDACILTAARREVCSAVAQLSADGEPRGASPRFALSPGDTCPGNARRTANGWDLFDFEFAEFRHVAWDAAYLLVPWPTCSAAWELPNATKQAAFASWLEGLEAIGADSAALRQQAHTAAVLWYIVSAAELWPTISAPVSHGPEREDLVAVRLAALAASRVSGFAATASLARDLASVGGVARAVDSALPLAPIFRPTE
jgi:hypothetical protein